MMNEKKSTMTQIAMMGIQLDMLSSFAVSFR